jgi:hypothetical protein
MSSAANPMSPASPPPSSESSNASPSSMPTPGRNPVLDIPLTEVIRPEIALPLQQILNLQTVGNLLNAWRSPRNHRSIEQLFDSPQQARNAVAVCATWLGVQMKPQHNPTMGWWRSDEHDGRVRASA